MPTGDCRRLYSEIRINRTTRRMSLTVEGETMLRHARSILAEMADLEQQLGASRSTPSGLLRINAQPRLDARTLVTLGIGPVSGLSGKPGFQEGFSPATLHLGFRVRSGGFYTQGLVSTAPRSITTLNMGVGASF